MTRQSMSVLSLTILAGAAVSLVYWRSPATHRIPNHRESVPAASSQHVAVWTAIEPSWTGKDIYSENHNREMGTLWNQVRTRQHWDSSDVDFMVYCLSEPPSFSGSNWDQADLQQNELAAKFMNATSIVSEHLQRGGTITEGGIEKLKVPLHQALGNAVPLVRGYAALALIQTDYLGDEVLEKRVQLLLDDPSEYVRSVLEAQFQNRSRRSQRVMTR